MAPFVPKAYDETADQIKGDLALNFEPFNGNSDQAMMIHNQEEGQDGGIIKPYLS